VLYCYTVITVLFCYYTVSVDSVPACRVSDLNCVDVPLNPTHSLTHTVSVHDVDNQTAWKGAV